MALGWKTYWKEKRNYVDITLITLNIVDIGLSLGIGQPQLGLMIIVVLLLRLGLRTVQVVRVIKRKLISKYIFLIIVFCFFVFAKPWLPKLYKFVDSRTKQSLFLGYDIGTGFVAAVDDVIKFLPQITHHPKIFQKLKDSLEFERLEALRAMGRNIIDEYYQTEFFPIKPEIFYFCRHAAKRLSANCNWSENSPSQSDSLESNA